MKTHLLFLLLVPLCTFSQTSHLELCRELLKDLQRTASDSTQIPQGNIQLHFPGGSQLDYYLSRCLPLASAREHIEASVLFDSINVDVIDLKLSINGKSSESSRNSSYLRQLDLNVHFFWNQHEYQWQGQISDELSKRGLKQVLNEEFPKCITGDYLQDQPTFRLVGWTTLGVFSVVAALFFMRT